MATIKPFVPQEDRYTIVDNVVFDIIMPTLSPNGWKVLCFVFRKTRGFHKDWDELAYSQILKGTGIKSSATLRNSIKELLKLGYIKQVKGDKWDAASYALDTALEIEVEPTSESKAGPTLENEAEPTLESEDTKQRNGETKENKEETKESPQAAARAMFSALARVCKFNLKTMTGKQRLSCNQSEKLLRKAGATPELLDAFSEWWYTHDWRGKKKEPPRPEQVRETWGQYTDWLDERLPSTVTPPAPRARCPLDDTWDEVLKLIRGTVTKATFDAHLARTRLVSQDDESWLIYVPSQRSSEWIRARLAANVTQAVQEYSGNGVQLEFTTLKPTDARPRLQEAA